MLRTTLGTSCWKLNPRELFQHKVLLDLSADSLSPSPSDGVEVSNLAVSLFFLRHPSLRFPVVILHRSLHMLKIPSKALIANVKVEINNHILGNRH